MKNHIITATIILSFFCFGAFGQKDEKTQDAKLFKTIKFYLSNKDLEKKTAKEANKLVDDGSSFLKARDDVKAKVCYQKAISKAKSVHGETSGLSSFIYIRIVSRCATLKRFKLATTYMDKSLPILRNSMAYKLKPFLYLNILSNALFIAGQDHDYSKFAKYLQMTEKEISTFSENQKKKSLPKFYSTLAKEYESQEKYQEAINSLKKAQKWTDKNDFESHCDLLLEIAYCYFRVEKYEKGHSFLQHALQLTSKLDIEKKKKKAIEIYHLDFFGYVKQSNVFRRAKKYKEAEKVLQNSTALLNKITNKTIHKKYLATIYRNKAWIYAEQKKMTTAIEYFKKAFAVYGKDFDRQYPGAAMTYLILAEEIKNEKSFQKHFKNPEIYFKKALSIAREIDKDIEFQAKIHSRFGTYYCDMHKYKIGIKHLQYAVSKFRKTNKNNPKISEIQAKIALYKQAIKQL